MRFEAFHGCEHSHCRVGYDTGHTWIPTFRWNISLNERNSGTVQNCLFAVNTLRTGSFKLFKR